ncbi:hypothetical protein [Streptomyces sp. CB02460]|uniref:hypothetical protein n=1 Tax=Streptomyces sp. CB02460 TaxID=1703941 RepID=UPI00093D5C9A|nr:hypothetical protein [Streptomyces sp. CB02460]OKJ76139.1 hypothetical protein AMK30_07810 [Streptomyces sp. CB02460]
MPPESAEPTEATETPGAGRTRHGLALGLVAASVMPVVLGGATASAAPQRSAVAGTAGGPIRAGVPGSATADQQPACGTSASDGFPIDTRIHGGPDTYASGGGYGTWFLDLTNTTTESCRAIHPVLVLTDEERALTSDQIQLQFSERARPGVEHRVTWETTDRDEHIGVFGGEGDDAFPGFTVPAGRTVTVQVRLAFTSDTSPGRITANAAIVQRRGGGSGAGGDGEWVGESEDYPFSVVEQEPDEDTTGTGETDGDRESADGTGREHVGGTGEDEDEGSGTVKGKGDEGHADPGTTGTNRRPVAPGTDPAGVPQLAATGISVPVPLPALTVSGFLIGGGAMVLATRRTRRADH